jgi:hypothetical protein
MVKQRQTDGNRERQGKSDLLKMVAQIQGAEAESIGNNDRNRDQESVAQDHENLFEALFRYVR